MKKNIIDDDPKKFVRDRFSGFDWANDKATKQFTISLVGAGGIGSWFALLATRIGHSLHIYDHDIVERHNVGGQLYSIQSVGIRKVDALTTAIKTYSSAGKVHSVGERVKEDTALAPGIIVSAVDNMQTRAILFDKFCQRVDQYVANGHSTEFETNKVTFKGQLVAHPLLFIDGRLLAEQFQVYAVTPASIDRYRETLFADEEVDEDMCSMRQTSHFGAGIAFNMIRVMNNYLANLYNPNCGREIPFKISDDGLLLLTTIEL